MHKRCSNCGILNYDSEVVCQRCHTPFNGGFGARRPPSEREAQQTAAATRNFNLIRPIVILVVTVSLGFAVYKMIAVPAVTESPSTTVQAPDTTVVQMNANVLNNAFNDSMKKDAELMKKMHEDMKSMEDWRKNASKNAAEQWKNYKPQCRPSQFGSGQIECR